MTRRVVDVLVPVALDRAYSYRVPDQLELAPGDIVCVPLGAREATAVVWADNPKPNPRLDNRLKDVEEKLELPPLRPELRSFVDWVANYTVSSRGMVLRMCLRMGEHLGAERERVGVRLAGAPPQRMTPARQRGMALFADGMVRGKSDAAREAGVSVGVIDGLIDEGTLETVVLPPEPVAQKPDPDFLQSEFTPDQSAAATALKATVAKGGYSVTLLDGVTGSGKTEVYFEAVADTIRSGRQSLILMPEIALTAQFLDRFAARFGVRPAEWHSELSPRRRARTWRAVADGEVPVVVGARSALFLPYADLGLIVVDEEHDPAYKQEDGVHYHARDMAVVRGHIARIPIVLSSATPSLESVVNARRGRYQKLALPERFGGQLEPAVEAIDLRQAPPPRGRFISPVLAGAMAIAIERGEQALLFLNRRGYAPLTLCRACGFRFSCPNCDAWLVDHRFRKHLICHHCGFAMPHPAACPKCQAANSFVACGPGVERLEEEVRELFPQARVLVLSSDLVASVERLREELDDVAKGRFDIIIGTQLVAKGHHFPMLNLVGVIDADLGLSNGDPRAAERTFQLLHQVIGRAGRDAGIGHGYLQTHQPEHPVMRALIAQDREAFYDAEIEVRERDHYPPFGRLASIVVSGPDKHDTESHARALARAAPTHDEVRILGPAEAPLALVRGRHRFRLLIKAPRNFDLSAYLRQWLAAAPKKHGSIKLDIDVDPQSFL
ncbi:MAG TPA: primosomal protein N' [Xanthobacteraceae bacterium]|jgi:primosomal protein N' (replication factor Y)|nr:primosomal protein N' [Xanthobacteraceae bacterium]